MTGSRERAPLSLSSDQKDDIRRERKLSLPEVVREKQQTDIEKYLAHIVENFYLSKVEIADPAKFTFFARLKSRFLKQFDKTKKIIKKANNAKVLAAQQLIKNLNALTDLPPDKKLEKIEALLQPCFKKYADDKGRFGNMIRYLFAYFSNVKQALPVKILDHRSPEFQQIESKLASSAAAVPHQESQFKMRRWKRGLADFIQPPNSFGGQDEFFAIQVIESLESKALSAQYEKRKEAIKQELKSQNKTASTYRGVEIAGLSENLDQTVGEVFLYHGTSLANSCNILASGFNSKKYCNAGLWKGYGPLGRGVYFSDQFSKSAIYAMCALCSSYRCACNTPDGLPIPKILILNKVMLGSVKTALKRDTYKRAEAPPAGFHTLAGFNKRISPGSEFKTTEIAIAQDAQVYPQYRIYYHHAKNLLKPAIWQAEVKDSEFPAHFNKKLSLLTGCIQDCYQAAQQQHVNTREILQTLQVLMQQIEQSWRPDETLQLTLKQKHLLSMLKLQTNHHLQQCEKVLKENAEKKPVAGQKAIQRLLEVQDDQSELSAAKLSSWLLDAKLSYPFDTTLFISEQAKTLFRMMSIGKDGMERAKGLALLSHYYYRKRQLWLKAPTGATSFLLAKRLFDALLSPENFPITGERTAQEIIAEITRFEKITDTELNAIIAVLQKENVFIPEKKASPPPNKGIQPKVLSNLASIYSMAGFPNDDYYAILYDAAAHRTVIEQKKSGALSDQKSEIKLVSDFNIAGFIQSKLELKIEAETARFYGELFAHLKPVFSAKRAGAIMLCAVFLDQMKNADSHILNIVKMIQNKLLYDTGSSVQEIANYFCDDACCQSILTSHPDLKIFAELMKELKSISVAEAVSQNHAVVLADLCHKHPALKNEKLARYFHYLAYADRAVMNYPAKRAAEAGLCTPMKSLFPERRGNKIVKLYSDFYDDEKKTSGAFFDMMTDIDQAKQSIVLAGWMVGFFKEMGMSDKKILLARLIAAAKRGVNVVMLVWDRPFIDYQKVPEKLKDVIEQYSLDIGVPDLEKRLFIKLSHRPFGLSDHQKMLVIDSEKLYTGGLDLREFRDWHDCHTAVTGPCVTDALELISARWSHQPDEQMVFPATNKAKAECFATDALEQAKYISLAKTAEFKGVDDSTMQLVCTLRKDAWGMSSHRWHRSEDNTSELQDAHLLAIQKAERFIYMENQYFIGSRFTKKDQVVESPNRVIDEIAKKIIEKHKANQPFHFYCLLPFHPNGKLNSIKPSAYIVHTLLRKTWKSMEYFIDKVNKATNGQAEKYITFMNAGKLVNGQFHQHYNHAKLMIVDDNEMLIGSANNNERSMVGDRDSENALYMKGQREAIRDYRCRLMQTQLGTKCLDEKSLQHGIEQPSVVRAVHKHLDYNLQMQKTGQSVDQKSSGEGTPWGNISISELLKGQRPPHVPEHTSGIVRLMMGVSKSANKSAR